METGPSNWLSGMRQALVLRFGAKRLLVGAVVGLMLVLSVEIAWSARQQSQTDDEADHILKSPGRRASNHRPTTKRTTF